MGIDDETAVDELESYVRTLERCRNLAESTVTTKRSRLATYTRFYRDIHGRVNLVDRLGEPTPGRRD
ncbi:hypothetical protein [Natrinema soli]|uniref:Integrase n=1 Tax=Natrinema soli TaxID=1930624 RepID=A0ABD5SYX4_9EURY|nr:hypothetical protein [Natrinema soli]